MPLYIIKNSHFMIRAKDAETARLRAIVDIKRDAEKVITVEKYEKKKFNKWRYLLLGK